MLRIFASAAREVRDVVRAATPTHRRLRDHLVTVAVATIGVDVLCAIAAFLLERHGQQTELKTIGSAAFWTTTQLLTVSSSITNPVSFGGRILDILMEVYAINCHRDAGRRDRQLPAKAVKKSTSSGKHGRSGQASPAAAKRRPVLLAVWVIVRARPAAAVVL